MRKIVGVFSIAIVFFSIVVSSAFAEEINCWFPPSWKNKPMKALEITKALSNHAGLTIKPRIAKSYPQILESFNSPAQNLVYVGSFIQAIIASRNLGTALVQNINGREYYSGVLIYPKGEDPEAILKNFPEKIAFCKGASSGESSAKAATGGKASIVTTDHGATCLSVVSGKAKAGVIKNWWWEDNNDKYSDLDVYNIPEISIKKNPDYILTASKTIPIDVQKKIISAAKSNKNVFGGSDIVIFDQAQLKFSLDLMKMGKIDPMTYNWE